MKKLLLPIFLLISLGLQAQEYVSIRQTIIDMSTFKTKDFNKTKTVLISGNKYKAEVPDNNKEITGTLTLEGVFKRKDGKPFKRYKLDGGGTLVITEENINLNLIKPHKETYTYYLAEKINFSMEEVSASENADCILAKDKVDDFTGAREMTSETMTVLFYENPYESGSIDFTLTYGKDGFFLLVTNKYNSPNGRTSKCFNRESKVLIKRDDGSIIELPAINTILCSEYIKGDTKFIGGAFAINDKNAQLLKSGIEKFRIQFTDSNLDGNFGGMSTILNMATGEADGVDEVKSLNSKYFFSRWVTCMEEALAKAGQGKGTSISEDW